MLRYKDDQRSSTFPHVERIARPGAVLAGAAARRYFSEVYSARRGRRPGLFALLAAGGALLLGCKAKDEVLSGTFTDDFQRAEVGPTWTNTGADYRITDGRLNVSNAYNHPAWLRKKLPHDVVIDFDAMSKSPAGDLKIELYGDGE